MRKLLSCSMVMAVLSVVGPQPTAAQNGGGLGAVMEWISRLSGPQFVGRPHRSFSAFTPDIGSRGTAPGGEESSRLFRVRVIWAGHSAAAPDDILNPAGSTITMRTVQPMLEIPIWPRYPTSWYFEAGIGYAWHKFDGDVTEFQNESIPAYVQLVRDLGDVLEQRVDVRIGVGSHYWMKFDDSDFAPLVVTLERNKREFTAAAFVALDWHVFPPW